MSMELPIVVYGNGDLYRELFNAIAAALSDKSYSYLIRLSILLAGTWAIVRFSVERSLTPLLRWLALYYLAFYIVFIPKVTVNIIDRVNQGHAYAVDHIPLGLGLIANLTSTIGDGLTQLTEKTFSLPNDLLYEKTGMVMAARLALASTQFQVTDPDFAQSLQSFTHQCIFYDLLLNKYSWNDLLTAPDVWSFVSNYASPARAFVYNKASGPQIITCKAGIGPLTQDWKNAVNAAAGHYGSLLFPQANDAKNLLLSYLPNAYNFLANVSETGQGIVMQNLMLNALQDGVMQMGASTNSPAALEAYSFAKAQQQKRLTNYTVGDMAAYWLPIMRNVLEAVLYGAFIFIFLLILFPFGHTVLRNYIASIMWIQLWAPLYAILNLFMSFYAQHASKGAITGQQNVTLLSQAGFAQVNADVASLAGYLSLSVPLLAAGMVKGLMSVFTQAAQYMAGVTQGAASTAAGEAVSGNLSLGNVNYSNQSSFNTSANHFDTNARVFSGMMTTQMAGGSTLSMTPDGTAIMNNQSAISNLGASVNLAESLRAGYTQQAERAESSALNQAHAYTNATSSGLRSLYELSDHLGTSKASGDSWSLSTNAQVGDAIGQTKRLTEKFAQDHHLSMDEAASVLGSAYANVSGGVDLSKSAAGQLLGIRGAASAGYRHDATNTDSTRLGDTYAAAKDFIHDTNFAHNVDVVARAAQEKSLRSSNEEGQRLIDNMGSSFDTAQSTRHEMMSSLQAAESYRRSASLTEENAVSINSNAGQVVFETLQKQGMGASEIENLMTHHPEQAQQLAQDAVQGYSQSLRDHWSHDLPVSEAAVVSDAQANHQKIPSDVSIQNNDQENHTKIATHAIEEGFHRDHFVDSSSKINTEKQIALNNKEITNEKNRVTYSGGELQNKVGIEQSTQHHGTSGEDFFNGINKK